MSTYPSPSANLTIFNPSYYTTDDATLTISEANGLYLKLTGGTESGSVTFSSGLTSNGNVNLNRSTIANVVTANTLTCSGNVFLNKYTYANVATVANLTANVITISNLTISSLTATTGTITSLGSTTGNITTLNTTTGTISSLTTTTSNSSNLTATNVISSNIISSTANVNVIGSLIVSGNISSPVGYLTLGNISGRNANLMILSNSSVSSSEGTGISAIMINSGINMTDASNVCLYLGTDRIGAVSYIQSSKSGLNLPLVLNNRGGSVGIGLSNPTSTLHVSGTANIMSSVVMGSTLTTSGTVYAKNGVDVSSGAAFIASDGAFFHYNGQTWITVDDHLYISDTSQSIKFYFDTALGYFGIGSTPSYPLDIQTSYPLSDNVGNGKYFSVYDGLNALSGSNTFYCAIRTTGSIWIDTSAARQTCSFVAAYSCDRRIKENIKEIEDPLGLIRKLKPVEFDYKDKESTYKQLGYIAQEVAEVLPLAVDNKRKNFIPNILIYGTIGDLSPTEWNLVLDNPFDFDDLKCGRLRIFIETDLGEESIEGKYFSHNEKGIIFKPDNEVKRKSDKVYVYGSEVDNFHTLAHEPLNVLAFAAVKQLDEKNIALEKRVTELEQQLVEILSRLNV